MRSHCSAVRLTASAMPKTVLRLFWHSAILNNLPKTVRILQNRRKTQTATKAAEILSSLKTIRKNQRRHPPRLKSKAPQQPQAPPKKAVKKIIIPQLKAAPPKARQNPRRRPAHLLTLPALLRWNAKSYSATWTTLKQVTRILCPTTDTL